MKKPLATKGLTGGVKRKPTRGGKLLVNHTCDKVLLPRTQKDARDSITNKQTNPIKNGRKTRIDAFPKKVIRMANGYVKRCSTSPVTQEMQFKTITGEQLTPVGRFIIKKTEKKKNTRW